jgi:hypothetical protein
MKAGIPTSTEINKALVTRFVNEYQTNGREEIAEELLAHLTQRGFFPALP